MTNRVVVHVDLDYFYAQAEMLRKPELKGKPLVICVYSGRTETSGAVATASYEARKYGAKAGIPIFRAKELLKGIDAVFLPMDYDYYESVSNHVMEIVRSYGNTEQTGIDECFVELNGTYKEAEEIAKRIKADILEKVGLTCSAGVGPNKLIAKIASDYQKPDGLTVVTEAVVPSFIAPMKLKNLIGIGPKSEEKLAALGVKTIGDLTRVDLDTLQEMFGPKLGQYFHDACRGIDNDPVEEKEAKQLGRIVTLKQNTRSVDYVKPYLEEMAADVAKMLKGREYNRVGVYVVFEDISSKTKSRTLEGYHTDAATMVAVAEELTKKMFSENDRSVRRLGVHVAGLRAQEAQKGAAGLQRFLKQ